MKKKKDQPRTAAKFTEEEMRHAVLRVAVDGISVNRVSQEVGLCKKTLKSYVDKYLSTAEDKKSEFIFRPNYEINQVFTHELEKLFEDFLLNVNRTDKKISRDYIRKSAFEFAMTCNLHVPKTWNVRRHAGLDWMYGFLSRHPIIKQTVILNKKMKRAKFKSGFLDDFPTESFIEETEVTVPFGEVSLSNAENSKSSGSMKMSPPLTSNFVSDESMVVKKELKFSRLSQARNCEDEIENTGNYFSNYLKMNFPATLESFGESDFSSSVSVKTPMDEFEENLLQAYCAMSRNGYVSSDRVYSMDEITLVVENPNQVEPRIAITACCFISPNGQSLPPFMIFPRSKFKNCMLNNYASQVCGVASPDGLIDDRIFLKVLHHFRDLTHASTGNKVVLILDDDDYHITVDTIDYCEKYGIEFVTLPPHCAGKLQPISRYAFKTLKSYFSKAYHKFRSNYPNQFVSMYDVSLLFNTIYPHSFTEENIVRGFVETGIYPLDEKIFAEIDALTMKLDNDDLSVELEHDFELIPSGIVSNEVSETEDNDDIENITICEMNFESESSDEETAEQGAHVKLLQGLVSKHDLTLAANFHQTPFEEYFDNLSRAFRELQHSGGLFSEHICNIDKIELSIPMPRGSGSGDDFRLVAYCCVNAMGLKKSPLFVFQKNEYDLSEITCDVENAEYLIIDKRIDENNIFAIVLEHFAQKIMLNHKYRIVLVIDNNRSYITIETIDFCRKKGIELVTIPSHLPPSMQPLERTVFKTLTSNFSAKYETYLQENVSMTVNYLIKLFTRVYTDAFSTDAIIKGFDDTGIWPLSREKICGPPSS